MNTELGGVVNSDYKIPDRILNDIPTYFYAAFAGELFSVFGPVIFKKPDTDDDYGLFYVEGTAGWVTAFRSVASRLGLSWLNSYYDSLDWFDSDLFDDQIGDLLIKEFIKANHSGANEYPL